MSHIEITHVASLHLTMLATYMINRNMVSVDLSAQARTGCVVTKGTRLCLESVGLSVLLKMNAVQFTLDGFELLFFSTISTFLEEYNLL